MSDCSSVELPSETVKKMAMDTIAFIRKERKKKVAEIHKDIIARERRTWSFRLWKWWHKTNPTDEEVLQSILASYENAGLWSPTFSADYYGWEDLSAATRLLIACKHTDKIRVSVEDLQRIAP